MQQSDKSNESGKSSNNGWKVAGLLALGGLAGYGIAKLLKNPGDKNAQIRVRSIEGRVSMVEGKLEVQGRILEQSQGDIRAIQNQNSNTMQRVARVETFLTQPLLPEAGENGDSFHSLN